LLSGTFRRHEQAEAEVGAIAEGERAADGFGKCDGESVARTVAPIATAVVADGLELQRAEASAAKLKRALAFVELLDRGRRAWPVKEQTGCNSGRRVWFQGIGGLAPGECLAEALQAHWFA